MLVYLFILSMILLLGLIMMGPGASSSNKKAYVIIVALTLFSVAAVRSYVVGVDTRQFCEAYVRIGFEGVAAFHLERYEYLFTALCLLLNKISSNYQLLIVISSALCIFPVAYLIYECSEDMMLSFFLYVTLNMYFSSMNTMRQSIAIGVLAIGLVWLMREKTWPFVASVLVAFLFHQSAIFVLVLLLVKRLPFGKREYLLYLLAAAVVFASSGPIVNLVARLYGRESLYSDEFMGSNYYGALIGAAVAFVCCCLCANYFSVSRKRGEEGPHDALLLHGIMLWFIFEVFKMRVEIVGRLGMYFMLFAILAIPTVLGRVPHNERRIVKLVACACFLIYFVVIGAARPEWYGAIPYVADINSVLSIF